MDKSSFNPASLAVNFVIGWFFLSFLHAAFRSLLAGSWQGLLSRFKAIALFHDGRAVLINLGIIAVVGIVAMVVWQLARQR